MLLKRNPKKSQNLPNSSSGLEVSIRGQSLVLLPEKAMYWPEQDVLLISDVHLGKISHFRKAGIGLPAKALHDNYKRLQYIIDKCSPSSIIFLGDLFHSSYNNEWMYFKEFREANKNISFQLIMGNHDILDIDMYSLVNLEICSHKNLDPFLLTHHPKQDAELYNLCGHIHPAIKIRGKGRQSIRMPCFFFSRYQGILPAFGTFTGSHALKAANDDMVFGITGDTIIRIQ